jgi:hypothetical protein
VVVELHAGHDGHLARELEEGAIRFVGLHHRPGAAAPPRVGAERAQLAADQETRVQACVHESERGHRGGGGLAVGARHRDRALERAHLAEQVAPVQNRGARSQSAGKLGVVCADGRGHDDLRPLGRWLAVPDPRLDAGLPETCEVRGLGPVRARDLGAQGARDECQAAHPGTADSHEVQPPAGEGRIHGVAR